MEGRGMGIETDVLCFAACLGGPQAYGVKVGCREGCQLTPWERLPVSPLGTQGTQPALEWCFLGRALSKAMSRQGSHLEYVGPPCWVLPSQVAENAHL